MSTSTSTSTTLPAESPLVAETTSNSQDNDRVRLEIEKAMANFSLEERSAYQKAPVHIIMEESPPHVFLQREQGNLVKAAKRLCLNWTMRFSLFQDRAVLPLKDLSGEGALSQDDIDYVYEHGNIYQLPPDAQGRCVVFMNSVLIKASEGGLPKAIQLEKRRRWEFYYFCYVAIQNPLSMSEYHGAVILQVVPTKTNPKEAALTTISATPARWLTGFTYQTDLSFSEVAALTSLPLVPNMREEKVVEKSEAKSQVKAGEQTAAKSEEKAEEKGEEKKSEKKEEE
jgi:hypothetical protein